MFDFLVDAVSSVAEFFVDDIPSYIMQGASWIDTELFGYGAEFIDGSAGSPSVFLRLRNLGPWKKPQIISSVSKEAHTPPVF